MGEYSSFSPIYQAYAKEHGESPDEMMGNDYIRYPGGVMCGFILWVAEKKRAFYKINPDAFLDRFTIYDACAWERFLTGSK